MGRQKTLWIDEESWKKLEEMGDDAISKKVRRCIMSHDLHSEAMIEALYRQVKALKDALKEAKVQGWWNE